MNLKSIWITAFLCVVSAVRGQTVLFVDQNATGVADGSTWCNACRNVQDALAAASGGTVDEVRVANGVYRPDQGAGQTAGSRNATFRLLDGVALIGGYAGCGAADPGARDAVVFEAILSGDLLANDGPNFANYAENSYHVVTYDDPTAMAVVLDGFTISGGNADGEHAAALDQGGAVHIRNGPIKCIPGGPTIRNCTIQDNRATHHGAVNDHGITTVIENCAFRNNVAGEEGAGLLVHSGNATVTDCLFEDNTVGFADGQGTGGGVWLGDDNDVSCPFQHGATFTNCVFRGNSSLDRGGGVFSDTNSGPTFIDCTFEDNASFNNGGGAYSHAFAGATFTRVLFTGNHTEQYGGGAYHQSGSGSFTDCSFIGNEAEIYGGGIRIGGSTVHFNGCLFNGNSAIEGGGLYVGISSTVIEGCTFIQNIATGTGHGGAGINGAPNSAAIIRDSLFQQNTTPGSGGGVFCYFGTAWTIENCAFLSNGAGLGGGVHLNNVEQSTINGCKFLGNNANYGGGAYLYRTTDTVVNCLFSGNSAVNIAGGVLNSYNHAAIINSTIFGNTAGTVGGVYAESFDSPQNAGQVDITNSIIWGNSDDGGSTMSAQIYAQFDAAPTANHSCVQGWDGGMTGSNTISTDPMFIDPAGADNVIGTPDDNLRLDPGSSAKDSGDNAAVPAGVVTDLDANPRVTSGTVDMGAYETCAVFHYYADVNDSGAVNFTDISLIVTVFRGVPASITFDEADIFPCGGDGAVNFQDISASVGAFRGSPPCPNICM